MRNASIIVKMTVAMLLLLTPISVCASEITDKIKKTVDEVLEVLKDESFKGEEKMEERRALLRGVVKERFSFQEMSRQSLARHWRGLSDAEKSEFVSLFSDLIESAYIDKVEGYTDEEILYTGERIKNSRAEVSTKVISKGTEIPINYRLFRTKDGDWMVYDIVIEGVSLVSNYRSQFSSTIRSSSFNGLMEQLREKTAE
jgi:phospholipid transport system substrate-binding protein